MKKVITCLTLTALLFLSITSCKKDDDVSYTDFTLSVTLPEEMGSNVSADGINIEITNTVNGVIAKGMTNDLGTATFTLEEGIYNITLNGEKPYSTLVGEQLFQKDVTINGIVENLSISGSVLSKEVELFISVVGSGWVFKELYFTGSQTPEGSSYYKDKYFEIYNNSDEVLYADGLSIGESDHTTAFDLNDWADIINEAFVTQVIYTIPGSGTDYPVQPGESIILADVGIDHTEVNANSFDLSVADFEWYDDHALDVDAPEVTNLIKYFSYSASIWTPHNRGFKSYVIFKPEGTMDEFLTTYAIDKINGNGSTSTRYKIPNAIILDAVELGTPSDFLSKALSASLDISYTHCGDADDSRYGKCVRRKTASIENGRVVYKDTNNSAIDFETTVDPKPGIFQ